MKRENGKQTSYETTLQSFRDELEEAVCLLAEEEPESAQLLQSKKVYKERIQQEIKSSFDSFEKTMQTAVIQLFSALTEIANLQPDLLSKQVRQDTAQLAAFPKALEESIKKIKKGAEQNKSYQEILGVSEATMEAFYQAAKYLYEHKQYEEASAVFQLLTALNAKEPLFWLALGNSEYFCQRHESALIAYAIAGHIDPFDPTCHLYSCKCYEELQQIDKARNALDLALIAIDGIEGQALLVQKIVEEQQRLSLKR